MPDGCYAQGLLGVGELADDVVAADPQGAQSAEPSAELVSCVRLAFEQSEGVLDGVDEGPVEGEQFEPRASCEDDAGQ